MKYAVIDTETSGLFDFSKPADESSQPRLAHFAMILAIDDPVNGLVEQEATEMLVRPDGWALSPEMTAINGLTTEMLAERGVPIADVFAVYNKAIDEGYIVAAFNSQFDTKVMRGEMRRAGIDDRFETTPNICIMRALTDICKVPKKTGKGFKFPKLSEACAHFGIEQAKAHTAMDDAKSAFALLRKLSELDAVPLAAVHYAKNRPIPGAVAQ